MDKVITREKCYIIGEKINMEKRSHDEKEKTQTRQDGVDSGNNITSSKEEIN